MSQEPYNATERYAVSGQELEFYKPSGAANPASVIATFALASALGAVTAAAYAALCEYMPLIYFCIAATVGFGFALGAYVTLGVRAFHIQSPIAAAVTAVLVFAVVYVVHWVFQIVFFYAHGYDVPFDFEIQLDMLRALVANLNELPLYIH